MAFFKFRKGNDETTSAPAQPQSIEVIRQRAKYRLVGATVLVLAAVVVLPLLLDSQPRPVAVNTSIDIPDKNKVPALVMAPSLPKPVPTDVVSAAPVAVPEKAPTEKVQTEKAPAEKVPTAKAATEKASTPKTLAKAASAADAGIITETAEAPKAPVSSVKKAPQTPVTVAQSASKPVAKVVPKPVPPAAAVAASKPKDADRAQALLDGKTPEPKAAAVKDSEPGADAAPPVAGAERFIVQVGAFAENSRAHEVRLKVEHAGLKTYTQVAETKDGKRIRVRVGPFASRAEADKVAEKIRKLDLPAALLAL